MIPRFSPDYQWSDLALCTTLPSFHSVTKLEDRFAHLTEHGQAIAFRYGRSGLYFLLKALGAKNKKVILPSYTCVVVAHAVVLSGNTPVFLDNALGSLQPDPTDYLKAIDADTVMVVPTHLFGIAEETSSLFRELKEKHPSVFLLQDCAHSFFCRDRTGKVVTNYGDGAFFGMNISKLVNSVYGGMLTLRDPNLTNEIRQLVFKENKTRKKTAGFVSRSYAAAATFAFTPPGYNFVSWLSKNSKILDSETKYFDPNEIELPEDFAAPLLSFEAQVGHRSLDRFPERIKKRSKIAGYYIDQLKNLKRIEVPPFSPGNTWSHFPVLVPKEKRNAVKAELEKKLNVEIGVIVDYSVADLPAYQKRGVATCPRARATADRVLNLPLTFEESLWPIHRWKEKAKSICETIISLCSSSNPPF